MVPTYQYACTACEEQLEVVQKFTDAPLSECPACAGQLRKVFSPVGIVFKGSGFYRTDSRPATGDGGDTAGANGDKAPAKDIKPAATGGSAADSNGSAVKATAGAATAAARKDSATKTDTAA
jgi:putative FmdB family regulatory protein